MAIDIAVLVTCAFQLKKTKDFDVPNTSNSSIELSNKLTSEENAACNFITYVYAVMNIVFNNHLHLLLHRTVR